MKKFRTYIAVLCTMLVAAACTNEMETETTATTDVAQLVKIGNFPAFEETAQTRAIGIEDAGKTAWAEGDEVLLKIQLKNTDGSNAGDATTYTLTCNSDGSTWTADKSLNLPDYRITTADITAHYAPSYQWSSAGSLTLKSGEAAGTDEYLTYTATGVSLANGIDIDFSKTARKYSRLRVAVTAGEEVKLTSATFTANDGTTTAAAGITATADSKGNAYFYGSWTKETQMGFKIGTAANTISQKIAAASIPAKSYAWMPIFMEFTVRVTEANGLGYNIPFPTSGTTPADITVYWGDGNSTAVPKGTTLSADDKFSHIYDTADDYSITITSSQEDKTRPQIPALNFSTNRPENSNAAKLYRMDTPLLNGSITDFSKCFYGCTTLGKIHAGLFANNTAATNFSNCFYGCTALNGEIPAGLFASNTKATDFSNCFYGCKGLKAIPAGLFDNNTAATDFNNCFNGCVGLGGEIPAGLFANNVAVTDFNNCFQSCEYLKLNAAIFINEAHPAATRFAEMKTAINFTNCFANCGKDLGSGNGGTAPALWNYKFGADPTSTSCFSFTNVTNANDIPNNWKGLE